MIHKGVDFKEVRGRALGMLDPELRKMIESHDGTDAEAILHQKADRKFYDMGGSINSTDATSSQPTLNNYPPEQQMQQMAQASKPTNVTGGQPLQQQPDNKNSDVKPTY